MKGERVRAVNAAIAGNYDALVFDPEPNPLTDPRIIFGHAAAFGQVRKPADVLDIGCGTGMQLLQASSHVGGRLVGTDISPVACERARQKLAPFGERATILCQDILELDPEELGEFDLIYVIGVIYVTPEEVQRKILNLIGRCLRPGGAVQITYYAGTVSAIRASLHATLRTAAGNAASREEAIAIARASLDSLSEAVADREGADMLRMAIDETRKHTDLFFFHEVLNEAFCSIQTGWLERELSESGVGFAGYLRPFDLDNSIGSRERALLADKVDSMRGQYRRAIFAKFDGPAPGAIEEWPVAWASQLVRERTGAFEARQPFRIPHTEIVVEAGNPATSAAFYALAEGPRRWPEIAEAVTHALETAGMEAGPAEWRVVQSNLGEMWKHGFIVPLSP
mgnify:CR=1 FL=1